MSEEKYEDVEFRVGEKIEGKVYPRKRRDEGQDQNDEGKELEEPKRESDIDIEISSLKRTVNNNKALITRLIESIGTILSGPLDYDKEDKDERETTTDLGAEIRGVIIDLEDSNQAISNIIERIQL